MFPQDPYLVSALEYLVALASLGCFVAFWTFVNGEGALSLERVREWSGQLAGLFRVPDRTWFHPGHAWARPDASGVVTIGLDDFAQQLIGSISTVHLPPVGASLTAGSPAWSIGDGSRSVEMLAPVTGTVVAVNDALAAQPSLANDDPYGGGWLARVRVSRAPQALRELMSGRAARAWMDRVSAELMTAHTAELGVVCQDGGMPVQGLARAIDEEHWDDVARRFLLS
jgi:glycine cleavage system H protein